MDINDDHLYTIKESSEKTGIAERTLSRIALKENVRKIDGRYLFTGSQLKSQIERKNLLKSKKENPSQHPRHSPLSSPKNDSDVEALIIENSDLKIEIENLKEELSQYDIADDERL